MEQGFPAAIEDSLKNAASGKIAEKLAVVQSSTLVHLLDSRFPTIGDAAAYELVRRHETVLVVEAVVSNMLPTATSRTRALFILKMFGSSCREAVAAYKHSLDDRNNGVLSGALFGIVFMRRTDVLPTIRKKLRAAGNGTERADLLQRAVHALEENNPSLYSPYYRDSEGKWDTVGE